MTAQIAESLGMARPTGALVSSVAAGGPAAKAGLKPGDVVLAMNGAAIEHVDALGYRLATQTDRHARPSSRCCSQGDEKTRRRRADPRAGGRQLPPKSRSAAAARSPAPRSRELSPRLAQRLGLDADIKGVTVVDIDRNSPAAGFGFQPRDIVREVNGEEIDTAEKLKQVAEAPSRWWRFTVERDGRLLRQMLRY